MSRRAWIWVLRAAVVAVLLLAWQFLPSIGWLSDHLRFFDRFFISSPADVARKVGDMLTGGGGTPVIWPYLEATVGATLLGSAIGIVLGMLAGLATSSNKTLGDVLGFFIVAANSVPRIALIPIVVLLAGIGFATSVTATVMVVFFLAYFNAFEGGQRVPVAILDNATVMGTSRARVMQRIRFPYVVLWTSAAIPNAVSFGLITTVTTELLSGARGVGQLLLVAISNLDATGTFAVVVFLSVVGLVLLSASDWLKRRILHWAVDQ